ncbi:hypothetical protein C8J57DRAFT_1305186 [Mycena rebaudengoi]|nr:hypothetical protein C8J57DRAFT_1305186 [Mycena rebaudengoi]
MSPAPLLINLAQLTRDALLKDERMLGELLRAPVVVDSFSGQVVDFKFCSEVDGKFMSLEHIHTKFHRSVGWDHHSSTPPTISEYLQNDVATGDRDIQKIAVHHNINSAFFSTGGQDLLKFLGLAIILHGLGHGFRALFASELLPYHAYCATTHANPPRGIFFSERHRFSALTLSEPGFAAEIGIFGGVIGAVFEDEVDGVLPPFFDLDYRKLKFLCLSRQEESGITTYGISADAIRQRIDILLGRNTTSHILPFSATDLFEISPPISDIIDRSAALLNSTHLPRSDAAELSAHNPCYESLLRDNPPRPPRRLPNRCPERRRPPPPIRSPAEEFYLRRSQIREGEITIQRPLHRVTFYRPPPLVERVHTEVAVSSEEDVAALEAWANERYLT